MTEDYGILSKEDLLYDIKLGIPNQWQCFPAKDITFNYDTWRDNDPMGRFDIIVTLCYFGIEVQTDKLSHVYIDRRARLVEFCEELHKEWKQLTLGESYLCLNGEPHGDEDKEKNWTWNKVKTLKGCLSLFEGDCDNIYED